jgi:hypothetical protein
MIFCAHLLPYGWLYGSRTYMVMSVIIPVAGLIIGLNFPSYAVAGVMILFEIVFSLLLFVEVKKLPTLASPAGSTPAS